MRLQKERKIKASKHINGFKIEFNSSDKNTSDYIKLITKKYNLGKIGVIL